MEVYIWVFGVFINSFFLVKLLLRPSLWSTINTFIGAFFLSNLLYLSCQVYLASAIHTDDENEEIVEALEKLYDDPDQSFICAVKYMTYFLHGSSIIAITLGTIFIRSMMIKYADNIRPEQHNCKSHQAQLRIIGVVVALYILTFISGIVIVFIVSPLSPYDFVDVRMCRQVSLDYPPETLLKIKQAWMARIVSLAIYLAAVISCHARIFNFMRHHNSSYFSHFRQNLATIHQCFTAVYIQISLGLLDEALFFSIIMNPDKAIDSTGFKKFSNVLNSIFIPCYWLYSTKKELNDLWSEDTLICRRRQIVPRLNNHRGMNLTEFGLQPRAPTLGQRIITDFSLPSSSSSGGCGRFYYGMKLKK